MSALRDDLKRLRAAIDGLPASFLSSRRDGPLAAHLSPSISTLGKGFQKLPDQPPNHDHTLLCRGKHGLVCLIAHYAQIVDSGDLVLIKVRIEQLLDLIGSLPACLR
ncbi:hypothetical protein DFH08DRAFT_826468 [Mycena albidolilacea]|uniref:Uncharacterized protein n=1 Tax=Mycena albidolilacea TaxID=1033008 RepID=A0AAD6Z0F5_9AGAR|nr:hypothetical protein DFH08DRAFT_826468 [Mycena albidolilacea]